MCLIIGRQQSLHQSTTGHHQRRSASWLKLGWNRNSNTSHPGLELLWQSEWATYYQKNKLIQVTYEKLMVLLQSELTLKDNSYCSPPQMNIPGSYRPSSWKNSRLIANRPPAITGDLNQMKMFHSMTDWLCQNVTKCWIDMSSILAQSVLPNWERCSRLSCLSFWRAELVWPEVALSLVNLQTGWPGQPVLNK